MPVRVGIDLVEVDAVREAVRTHRERYLTRIYTEREVADCQTPHGPDHQRLASRFAAKEAALKVLRPDEDAIPWRAIEVRRDGAGWAEIRLTGVAARRAVAAHLGELAVSISHEHGYAAAVVVGELRPPAKS